jgi:hypothetical protein
MEPPLRFFARLALKRLPMSLYARERWALSKRPAYLTGVLAAAQFARSEGLREMIAIEFGVAGGEGILALQEEANAVETETGVRIKVYGFDSGDGLPEMTGDYRDHPDYWKCGDFPLDEASLRRQLTSRTNLILGPVKDTVPEFIERTQDAPVGFVSFDLDLYSSTKQALRILSHPKKSILKKVPLYFDDVLESMVSHRFAGELLAIEEFNEQHSHVKIDVWRGIQMGRPFPEHPYLHCMYLAHDLEAISGMTLDRDIRRLPMGILC